MSRPEETGFTLDTASEEAPYVQLQQAIRRQIVAGRLRPGDRLQSVRQLARAAGVSPFTANRAIRDLAREGLVVARNGSGTYVTRRDEMTIEVIVSYSADVWPDAPQHEAFFGQFTAGLQSAAPDGKLRCFLSYIADEHARASEIVAVCQARHAGHLVVYRPCERMARELAVVSEAVPVITLKIPLHGTRSSCILIDPTESLRRVLQARLARGHRRFCLVGVFDAWREPFSPYVQMHQAALSTLAEAGLAPEMIMIERFGDEGVEELRRRKLNLADGTVLIAAHPHLIGAFRRKGREVEVISYTEGQTTRERFRREATLLYGGLERCAPAVVELLSRPLTDDRADRPRIVRVTPEVIEADFV